MFNKLNTGLKDMRVRVKIVSFKSAEQRRLSPAFQLGFFGPSTSNWRIYQITQVISQHIYYLQFH